MPEEKVTVMCNLPPHTLPYSVYSVQAHPTQDYISEQNIITKAILGPLQFIYKIDNLLANFDTLPPATKFYLHNSHSIMHLLPPDVSLDTRSFGVASYHSWQILKASKPSQDKPGW